MKPPRFTLRLLLVVVTIAAVGLGIWRHIRPPLTISERAARAIAVGMTEEQVKERLGWLESYSVSGNSVHYCYNVSSPEGTEPGYLSVTIGTDGKVTHLERTGRSQFVFPE